MVGYKTPCSFNTLNAPNFLTHAFFSLHAPQSPCDQLFRHNVLVLLHCYYGNISPWSHDMLHNVRLLRNVSHDRLMMVSLVKAQNNTGYSKLSTPMLTEQLQTQHPLLLPIPL